MDIIFKGRRTEVQERFRTHASAKLSKIKKLDHKAIRVDVEVSTERNPRQSNRRERVELTIRSRGPVIRAEAAADDRFAALDRALAKLEERLRRTGDRRKALRHGLAQAGRAASGRAPAAGTAAEPTGTELNPRAGRRRWRRKATVPASDAPQAAGSETAADYGSAPGTGQSEEAALAAGTGAGGEPGGSWADGWQAYPDDDARDTEDIIPIQMEGDAPVVVREKFHQAVPISVDRALLEMELVGHDFYLFRDEQCGLPSVVYRRHGYHYGLIRLVEQARVEVRAERGVRA